LSIYNIHNNYNESSLCVCVCVCVCVCARARARARVCVRVLYMSVYMKILYLFGRFAKDNHRRDVATKETIVTIV